MGSPIGKTFNARFPESLHCAIKQAASLAASKHGGQTNMNKLIVEALYAAYRQGLSDAERAACDLFISRL
jgi:hypothetical protein